MTPSSWSCWGSDWITRGCHQAQGLAMLLSHPRHPPWVHPGLFHQKEALEICHSYEGGESRLGLYQESLQDENRGLDHGAWEGCWEDGDTQV